MISINFIVTVLFMLWWLNRLPIFLQTRPYKLIEWNVPLFPRTILKNFPSVVCSDRQLNCPVLLSLSLAPVLENFEFSLKCQFCQQDMVSSSDDSSGSVSWESVDEEGWVFFWWPDPMCIGNKDTRLISSEDSLPLPQALLLSWSPCSPNVVKEG